MFHKQVQFSNLCFIAATASVLWGTASCSAHTQNNQIYGEHAPGQYVLLELMADYPLGDHTRNPGLHSIYSSHSAELKSFTGSPTVAGNFYLFFNPTSIEDPGLVFSPFELTAEHRWVYDALNATCLIEANPNGSAKPNNVRANTHSTSIPEFFAVNDPHVITGQANMP
jgi:hypothetical protein